MKQKFRSEIKNLSFKFLGYNEIVKYAGKYVFDAISELEEDNGGEYEYII